MSYILVVDDSKTVRNLLSYILKSHGFRVKRAPDGIEALEMVFRENFDLVITDINMPRMDGLELIRLIRKEDVYRFLPIIVLTTESSEEDRRLGIKAGANLYLVKPSDPETLMANVGMLLGIKT